MVGIDIVEIERFKKMKNFESFISKVCTQKEIEYVQKKNNIYETVAGIFCAKEAVAKALGIGLSKMTMHGCEILHGKEGQPYAVLYGYAKEILRERTIHISISHSGLHATAIAMICG